MVDPRFQDGIEPILSVWRAFARKDVVFCFLLEKTEQMAGNLWLHEIKHDGFRVIARKEGKAAKLYSRPGNDLTRPPARKAAG